jgi:hypothetical protein
MDPHTIWMHIQPRRELRRFRLALELGQQPEQPRPGGLRQRIVPADLRWRIEHRRSLAQRLDESTLVSGVSLLYAPFTQEMG